MESALRLCWKRTGRLIHNHFDKWLNVEQLLVENKPKNVVECGAGSGTNSDLLIKLSNKIGFSFTIITDNNIKESQAGAKVMRGVSYRVLSEMENDSIDVCIIDTDHNYWTLMNELESLHAKLKTNGLVLMHDVDTFYFDTGIAEKYADGSEYPKEIIEKSGQRFGGLGNALMDFLSKRRFEYKMVKYVSESHGAAAIQKVMRNVLAYYKPANNT